MPNSPRIPEFQVHYIDKQADFEAAMSHISTSEWIGFDTEFVGEKTFVPVFCLLQVVAGQDIFLIDPLKINDLRPFLALLENPDILKLTHAGDNDYKLMFQLYGTIPTNTFDTQIAAGFVGHNYPAGFGKLCEKELKTTLSKSHTVTDWAARPLPPKALQYAVEDVKYLPGLWRKLSGKLEKRARTAWQREENAKWEVLPFYTIDPYKEALGGELIYQLHFAEQLFLLRMHHWRRSRAEEVNQPREVVLQAKYITPIVKAIKSGREGFTNNRVLHDGVWKKNLDEWLKLYKTPATEAEKNLLDSLPGHIAEDPELEWTLDLLYLLVRRRCLDHKLSPALVMPRGDFNKMRNPAAELEAHYLHGWRADLLGPELIDWFTRRQEMRLEFSEGSGHFSMP